jgi:glycosyltransferase involved in cell wall biosynthesis
MNSERQKPKVGIIIPVYNEEDYIIRTLESFANQQLPSQDYCVVVVDNNSTDNTRKVVEDFQRDHPELNIELTSEPKKGAGSARKKGCEVAISYGVDYLVNLDAGARYDNEFLSKIVEILERNPKVGIVYAQENYDDIDIRESVDRLFSFHGWDRKFFEEVVHDTYDFIKEQWKIGREWDNKRYAQLTEEDYPIAKRIRKGDKGEEVVEKCRGAGSAYRVSAYLEAQGFDPTDNTAEDLRLARRIFDTGKWDIETSKDLYFFESGRRYLPPVNKDINYNGLNCVFVDFGLGYRKQGVGEEHDRIRTEKEPSKKLTLDEFKQNRQDVLKYCRTVGQYVFLDLIPDEIKGQTWFKKIQYGISQ